MTELITTISKGDVTAISNLELPLGYFLGLPKPVYNDLSTTLAEINSQFEQIQVSDEQYYNSIYMILDNVDEVRQINQERYNKITSNVEDYRRLALRTREGILDNYLSTLGLDTGIENLNGLSKADCAKPVIALNSVTKHTFEIDFTTEDIRLAFRQLMHIHSSLLDMVYHLKQLGLPTDIIPYDTISIGMFWKYHNALDTILREVIVDAANMDSHEKKVTAFVTSVTSLNKSFKLSAKKNTTELNHCVNCGLIRRKALN